MLGKPHEHLIPTGGVRVLPRPQFLQCHKTFEPRCEKTGLRGFRPGPTQTGLCSHRIWLEA